MDWFDKTKEWLGLNRPIDITEEVGGVERLREEYEKVLREHMKLHGYQDPNLN